MRHDEIFRIRRVVAVGGLMILLLGLWAGVRALGGEDDPSEQSAAAADEAPPAHELLPEERIVAFYGAPQDPQLGALGIGSPADAAARLRRQAKPYEKAGKPVVLAFELIATIANADPGDDGLYRTRQPAAVIRRYLKAAREAGAILILDIQPGHADFLDEVRALEEFLREPDVSLALDPEWSVPPPAAPGQEIGSMDAETVNEVQYYLSTLIRAGDLPDKLLVVHQFTEDMVQNKQRLRDDYRGVDLLLNVDGFGTPELKRAKYRDFTSLSPDFPYGFKLFYEEDTDLMSPRQVLRLRPQPELVVYE